MLWKMFITFFKIGAFTFGGGYAMIPIIQNEIVDKHKWINEEEFIDALSLTQASPGPVAVNTSIYVGYKLRKIPGAIICTLGTVLPSFIVISIIARFFSVFKDNPAMAKVFMGVRPAVVALILAAVYKLFKSNMKDNIYRKLTIILLTIGATMYLKISPIWIILSGAVVSVIYNKVKLSS